MTTTQRLANTGIQYIASTFDEVTNNPASFGSILFSGSNYLTVPSNAAFNFGTGNFTIEVWAYWSTAKVANETIYEASTGSRIIFGISSTGVRLYLGSEAGQAYSFLTNTWYHIAVVRSGSTITIYVNGISIGTTTNSTSFTFGSHYIGRNSDTAEPFTGRISNLRIVNGTAVYTTAFTPPTQPLTAITNTSLLLNTPYTNDAFVDSSTNGFTVTNNGNVVSSPQTPFNPDGYYSYLFNGSTQYLTANGGAGLTFGTGDFTIEFWYNWTSTSGQIIDFRPAGVPSTSGYIVIGVSVGTILFSTAGGTQITGATLTAGTWYHIALVKISNSTKLYINGVQSGSTFSDTQTYSVGASRPIIASDGNSPASAGYTSSGYVSNVRMVKGVGVYTGTFTPPTIALRAIQSIGTNIAAITGNSTVFTSLLTCQSNAPKDNGANNLTMTATAGPIVYSNTIPFSTISYANTGLAVSKQYSNGMFQTVGSFDEVSLNPTLNGSVLFNGSTQYMYLPGSTSTAFGTSNFTIECWIYTNAYSTNAGQIIDFRPAGTSSTSGYVLLTMGSSGILYYNTGNANYIVGPTLSLNTWYHIALVKISTTTTLYVNGTSVGSFSDASSYLVGANRPTIGTDGNVPLSGGYSFNGYISNLRITNGLAVYTGAFTPPTQALTRTQLAGTNIAAITNQTVFLMKTLTTDVSDISTNNLAITPVGIPVNTIANPFGTDIYGSMLFNGSQYLSYSPGSSLTFGSSNFTVEMWIYPTVTIPSTAYLFDTRVGGGGSWCFGWGLGSFGASLQWYNGGVIVTDPSAASTYLPNTWYHVAYVKNGSTGTLYRNGVAVVSATDSSTYTTASTTSTIGISSGISQGFTGYIANLRIVKGTAVYTAAFTPPTAPLTAIANTSLLTCQSIANQDNSTNVLANKVALTNNGSTPTSNTNPFSRGYSSVSFNGTSQFLQATTATTWLPSSTSDWTIEAWINLTGYSSSYSGGYQAEIASSQTTNSNTNGWQFVIGGTASSWTGCGIQFWPGNINVYATTPINLNTWYHIAVTKQGTTVRVFLNGVLLASGTPTTADGVALMKIGALDYTGYQYYFPGYISNLRIVKGTAVYTAAFTPPTQPLTAITNTAILTCQSMVFQDNSINNFAITNNGAATASQAVIPFQPSAIDPVVTSGTALRKQYNTGLIQVYNQIDEYTGIV